MPRKRPPRKPEVTDLPALPADGHGGLTYHKVDATPTPEFFAWLDAVSGKRLRTPAEVLPYLRSEQFMQDQARAASRRRG